MAALVSPGVSVSVIDESISVGAGEGTVPFILISTAQDKTTPDGTIVADGTTRANANKLYLMTSQRELLQTFGDPEFQSVGGNAIHGSPLNEYGLLAAHSYLGLANRAYIIRADVDLSQLEATVLEPTAPLPVGTIWIDTDLTQFGLQEVTAVDSGTGAPTWTPAEIDYVSVGSPLPDPTTGSIAAGTYGVEFTSPSAIDYNVVDAVILSQATADATIANGAVEVTATVTDGGTGYTSAPIVLVSAPDGVTATADVTTLDGAITGFTNIVSAAGYTSVPTVTLSVPNGTPADTGTNNIANTGGVPDSSQAAMIISGGSGYTTPPTIVQIFGPGSGGAFTAVLTDGVVTDITVVGGTGYTGAEELSMGQPSTLQAVGTAVLTNGELTGITLDTAGEGYATGSTVTLSAPGLTQATASSTLTADVVSSVTIVGGSSGYATVPTLTIGPAISLSWVKVSDAVDFQFASVEPSTQSDGSTPLVVNDAYIRTVASASGANYIVSVRSGDTGQYVIQPAPMFGSSTDAEAFYGDALSIGDFYIQTGITTSVVWLFRYNGTGWSIQTGTDYYASPSEPRGGPADEALWYNPDVGTDGSGNTTVDILVNNGTGSWEALNMDGFPSAGPKLYLQSSNPVETGATLLDGDVWVDTDQINDYPVINKWKLSETKWVAVDNADQTSNNGIVFADARPEPDYIANVVNVGDYNGGGADMDIDVPDPAAYPKGMLLWNTRYSTRNVKQWNESYIVGETVNGDAYSEGRWTNASGNNEDGSPKMGTDSQRGIVTMAMQAVLVGNDDLRSEFIFYNLIATPGFPETIDEMISLNIDRKETGFIIADSPFDLAPDATSLLNWTTNANNAPGNGQDGLLSADPYLGVYYPSALGTNIDGTDVVVPPSHMMLRTMVFNDQVSYPWFAPAGLTRGRITNASSVGYVTSEGEFQPVTLNQGQRDVLYTNNVNPIAFIPNEGLVAFGQKTRNAFDSALSRINVARLVNYIRYQAENLARPFLFEPNDSQTRDNVKDAYDRFLAELVTLRGLSDFLVVCDQSNNTPGRIDKNELWIDLAIVPIKAIEFIYIPIRIKNTGADLSANIGN